MQDFKFKMPKNDQNPVVIKLALLVFLGIDEGSEGKGLFLLPFFDKGRQFMQSHISSIQRLQL